MVIKLMLQCAVLFSQTFAAVLYFFGDNVDDLMQTHFVALNSTYGIGLKSKHLDITKYCTAVALVVSIFIFQNLLSFFQECFICTKDASISEPTRNDFTFAVTVKGNRHPGLLLVPSFIKTDIAYTIITKLADKAKDSCKFGIALIVLTAIVSFVIIVVSGAKAAYQSVKKGKTKISFIIIIVFTVLSLTLPVFLVGKTFKLCTHTEDRQK